MLYDTQNYWVFGLRLSSGILNIRENKVLETGCVRSQVRAETPTLLGPLERANLDHRMALALGTELFKKFSI
jgi:hypothetical protein